MCINTTPAVPLIQITGTHGQESQTLALSVTGCAGPLTVFLWFLFSTKLTLLHNYWSLTWMAVGSARVFAARCGRFFSRYSDLGTCPRPWPGHRAAFNPLVGTCFDHKQLTSSGCSGPLRADGDKCACWTCVPSCGCRSRRTARRWQRLIFPGGGGGGGVGGGGEGGLQMRRRWWGGIKAEDKGNMWKKRSLT